MRFFGNPGKVAGVSDPIPTSPTGKRLERPILAGSLPRLERRRPTHEQPDAELRSILVALVLWTILLAILFVQFSAAGKVLGP
jgi:hypothetical protein